LNYYTLSAANALLAQAPIAAASGTIGINLGMVGVLMFFLIYLYPLRKNGMARPHGQLPHWLDFHVVLGTARPLSSPFTPLLNSVTLPVWLL